MHLTIDQHSVYCYTGGVPFDASRPAIVLLHGAQNDHCVWALQSRYLAHHGYAVLAPDLPGHGASAAPALTSVEAMADWLLALLDGVGVQRAMLAGHSMGSLVVLEAAQRAPERALGLALLGSTWPMRVSDALLDSALNDQAAAIEMVLAWSHMHSVPGPSTVGPGMSVTGMARRLMQRISQSNGAHVLHTDFSACNDYANGALAAASVRCPTVLVQGRADMMTPARGAKELLQALPEAEIVTVPSGHAMMAEAPLQVRDALLSLARRVAPGALRQ